jgi:DNA-directed RNA polymerase specialized sigma24 family protein
VSVLPALALARNALEYGEALTAQERIHAPRLAVDRGIVRRQQSLIDVDPPEEVSDLYHRALELVRSEFEARTWQAFWRATVDGQRVDLIAADLGVTTAAVRKSKSRVLRRLKEEVGDLIT